MRAAKAIGLEALLVGVVGLVMALIANAFSPLGLRLSRNYFPGAERAVIAVPLSTNSQSSNVLGNTAITGSGGLADATLQRLRQRGLQLVASNEVFELFRDRRYEQGLVVFIDARNDQHYQAGHIPSAWPFDHYHPENYLGSLMPVCLSAQKIVVYCTGGTCEDSEFAAVMLRDTGVPQENLFVYAGGIAEWMAHGMPVEIGARRSGQFKAGP